MSSDTPRRRPNTRAKNAYQHPAQILLEGRRKRRSSSQIAADRKRLEEDRIIQAVAAQLVAQLENNEHRQREASSVEAARPLTRQQVSKLKTSSKGMGTGHDQPFNNTRAVAAENIVVSSTNKTGKSARTATPRARQRGNRLPKHNREDFRKAAIAMTSIPQHVDPGSNSGAGKGVKSKTPDEDMPLKG